MKTVGPNEVVPFGLSRMAEMPGYRLKFPVWCSYGRHYDAMADRWVTGWFARVVLLRFNSGVVPLQSAPKLPEVRQ